MLSLPITQDLTKSLVVCSPTHRHSPELPRLHLHSHTSNTVCICVDHPRTIPLSLGHCGKISFRSHRQSSQNVGFCRGHCQFQTFCKVCNCRFVSYFCRHRHSQSFCKFCAMGPHLTASSPHKEKLRVLCLHGFRTNGSIMETQMAKLGSSVLDRLDMLFLDAPYPAAGRSDVEGIFPPPYYEWFQYEKTETNPRYTNLKECIQFITDVMETQGPFDGLVGFSQGAFLSAALAGMQQQGLALTSVPVLRFVIIISGGMLAGDHEWKGCYSKPILCPSVHLIGANDFIKSRNEELLLKFENPVVIRHGARHTVPRLDEKAASPLKAFLEDIVSAIREEKDIVGEDTISAIREDKDHATCLALA